MTEKRYFITTLFSKKTRIHLIENIHSYGAKAKVTQKGTTNFIGSFIGDMLFTSVLSELALKWFRCSSQIHHDLPETGAISSTYCLTISKQFATINHVLLPASCALLIRFFIPLN